MYKRVVSKPGRRRSIGRQATKALNRSLTSPEKSPANVKSCIKVVVRVRPENERELQSNQRTIVRVIDENMLIFDPVEESADVFFHGQKLPYRDITKRQNKDLKFMFDHVFGPDAANEQLFEHTTKDLINNLLNGYNCSVFAYGATGSGKTYTMLGSEDNPGIVFMTMMELYKRIEEVKEEKQFDVSVSYLEVYNETIRDLLTPCTGLQVREDPQRGVVISGLSSHKPRDAHDLLNMLQFGNRNRTQHPTDANAESSRSHAIFQVCVKQQDRTAGLSSSVRFAKMSLIDLAGSERASIVTKCNERFREGANINKSLLALGNCINALADRKTKGHVPYRNSKLTHILKDSLGGNCNTVMISAVSPSLASFEDTYNTLKYADRAKSIRLNVKRNVLSVDAHISKYAKIVDDLRKEIAELKQKIKTYESEAVVSSPTEMMDDDEKTGVECTCGAKQDSELQVVPAAPPSLNIDDVTRIEKLFANNKTLRSNVLKFESSLRNIEVQMHFRRSRLEHFAALDKQEGRLERSAAKVDLALRALEDRCRHVTSKKQEVETTLEANKKEIEELKTELLNTYTGALAEHLQEIFKREELEAEKAEMQVQFSHMQEMGAVLEKENANTERLLVDALNLVRMQQSILNGHGFLTTDLLAMFESLVKQSQAPKEVTWADQTPPPPLVMYQSFLYLPTIASTMPKHGQPPKALSVVEPGFKAEDDVARTAGDNDIMTTPPKPVRLDTTFAISPSSRSRACKSLSNLFISENDNLPEPPSESSPLAIKGQADSKPNWFLLSASPQCSVSVSRDEERTPQKILNMTFSVEQVDEETKGECSMVSVQQSTKSYPTTGQNESPSTPPLPKLSCTMTFKVETPRAPKPLSLQSAQTLALPSTSSSTLDDGDDKDVKVPLNTSYTISESSLDAADCPSTCVTVAATKTGKPPSILMQQQPSSAKKSAGMKTQYPNSPFRALTPRNDVNKNATKRETFKVSFKTNDSFKSYMSTTAASRGKVRHHRWHSSVKENTAPYVVQKWHRNSLRATSSDSEKERIRPSWGILKKKSQSSTSIR